ncbi:MAG: hypothetical protein LQ340_007921 [Diploschistes diacapsis]|nr:MAG: hypothetical protein LQ340_007921 [Diploschistes diacapsis]
MHFQSSLFIVSFFTSISVYAHPIPEDFTAVFPELRIAQHGAHTSLAEKRELEASAQDEDQHISVPREADQDQVPAPRLAIPDLLEDMTIPASTVANEAEGLTEVSKRERVDAMQERIASLEP